MIGLYSGHLYDFEKHYEEHSALLAAFKKGGAMEVQQAFRAMVDVFRTQDMEYLRAAESQTQVLGGGVRAACIESLHVPFIRAERNNLLTPPLAERDDSSGEICFSAGMI